MIVLKNDKQMVHLLEGKLFKRGGDISVVKAVFSRHKNKASVFLFACGCWLAVAGLVMLGAAGVAVAVCGAIFIFLEVFGRMRSFLAAERELG